MTKEAYTDISASMPYGVGAYLYETLGSTNDKARGFASNGAEKSPLWIITREQTLGRGRRGREWIGLTGNFFASLLWSPQISAADMAGLPFVVALSIREALMQIGVPTSQLACKWPNDILLDGAKVAGTLIEASIDQNSVKNAATDYIIIGVGINLAKAPKDTPYPATSVAGAMDIMFDPIDFLPLLAAQFSHFSTLLEQEGFAPVRTEWLASAYGVGQPVTVNSEEKLLTGTFNGVADDGAFILGLDGGGEKRLYAGDIFPQLAADLNMQGES